MQDTEIHLAAVDDWPVSACRPGRAFPLPLLDRETVANSGVGAGATLGIGAEWSFNSSSYP